MSQAPTAWQAVPLEERVEWARRNMVLTARAAEALPSLHGGHDVPPQSAAVSPPFWTPSAHPGSTQVPATHRSLAQSLFD